jgi:cbb3-type cytochrome c oxidase subunit III
MIFKIPVLLAIVAVFALLRFRKTGLLVWALAWWLGFFVLVRFGFTVPIPSSVVMLYMGIASLALAAYVTSSTDRRTEISAPIVDLIVSDRRRPALVAVALLLPALVAGVVWMRLSQPVEAPFFARTVHPASPAEITFKDQKINLDTGDNPYRALEKTNPEEFKKHVEAGRTVYYQNCHFCHGDNLESTGMFVHGLDPIPTNFNDQGTIPMLRETFLFWRISKGGPGLPDEGGPWASAMPSWEKFLSDEQIWDAILFLYDYTGRRPRAKEGSEAK